ncbi:piggyBac transposable element-derived protein 4-like [Contarinia nasturtii]|uniref:piggyBac transposable element-derived protein 4-like n=1 Tax=Contarinia nasturtii TaxID=265458 RepID=UPI0012D3C8CC|nr:piggyBac transposable element-derived protein 4-like [Contarinia nasturtii]
MARPKYLTQEELETLLNETDDEDADISDDECELQEDSLIETSDSDVEEPDDIEIDGSADDIEIDENADPTFISKDGIVWNSEPVTDRSGRLRKENVITLRPGLTRFAKNRVDSIKDAFLLFFPSPVENIILKNSNAYAKATYGENAIEIDSNLLHAYIAVLILAGVYRSKNENLVDLFDGEYGRPIFRAIMSKKTFQYMSRVMRFDDVMNRRQQKSTDKFAPIRDLFDKWSELLPDFYNPSECVTVDEQLLGFRGRCKFRQYMPSKPEKYGIKFWQLVCSKTCYVWKIQPYLGKAVGVDSAEKGQGARVVLDLIGGLKGHNVTMDNFFSSYELGQKLLSKGLTMVGTMRKNKRSIPPKLLECKKVPLYQSTFAFTKDTTLVSYVGRKNKCTILQSTMHSSNDVGSGDKKLPEIIEYYNKTKGGVDTVDKMLSCYSCKRKTNRWPMVVFSNIIDISALNAFVIFKEVSPNWQTTQKTTLRRNFLRELGYSLAQPYMDMRKGVPRSESSASLLSASRESLQWRESSPAIQSSSSSISRESSMSREGSPTLLPSTSFEIPRKRAKSVPSVSKGRSRCHMCYTEKSANRNNMHETICCFCTKGVCKSTHNRNVCVKCIVERLL